MGDNPEDVTDELLRYALHRINGGTPAAQPSEDSPAGASQEPKT